MVEDIFAFSPCCYNSQINKVLETSSIIVVQTYDALYNLKQTLKQNDADLNANQQSSQIRKMFVIEYNIDERP